MQANHQRRCDMWLNELFSRRRSRTRTGQRPTVVPRLESLEVRAVPTAVVTQLPGHSGAGRGIWSEARFADDRVTRTMDLRGNVLSETSTYDFDGNGVIDSFSRLTSTYNARGQPVQQVIENDDEGDGVTDYRGVSTFTYDARGNLVLVAGEGDFGVDGTVDDLYTDTLIHDSRGNPVRSTLLYDFGADGVI